MSGETINAKTCGYRCAAGSLAGICSPLGDPVNSCNALSVHQERRWLVYLNFQSKWKKERWKTVQYWGTDGGFSLKGCSSGECFNSLYSSASKSMGKNTQSTTKQNTQLHPQHCQQTHWSFPFVHSVLLGSETMSADALLGLILLLRLIPHSKLYWSFSVELKPCQYSAVMQWPCISFTACVKSVLCSH